MRTGDWVKLFRSYGVRDLQRKLHDVIYIDSELFLIYKKFGVQAVLYHIRSKCIGWKFALCRCFNDYI